jgi:hypothetical protein
MGEDDHRLPPTAAANSERMCSNGRVSVRVNYAMPREESEEESGCSEMDGAGMDARSRRMGKVTNAGAANRLIRDTEPAAAMSGVQEEERKHGVWRWYKRLSTRKRKNARVWQMVWEMVVVFVWECWPAGLEYGPEPEMECIKTPERA